MIARRHQSGGALKSLLWLLLIAAAIIGGLALYAPEHLPASLRSSLVGPPPDPRDDPSSPRYSPAVYRWKDAQGVMHVSDVPPQGRKYDTVRINPDTNIVPGASTADDE